MLCSIEKGIVKRQLAFSLVKSCDDGAGSRFTISFKDHHDYELEATSLEDKHKVSVRARACACVCAKPSHSDDSALSRSCSLSVGSSTGTFTAPQQGAAQRQRKSLKRVFGKACCCSTEAAWRPSDG